MIKFHNHQRGQVVPKPGLKDDAHLALKNEGQLAEQAARLIQPKRFLKESGVALDLVQAAGTLRAIATEALNAGPKMSVDNPSDFALAYQRAADYVKTLDDRSRAILKILAERAPSTGDERGISSDEVVHILNPGIMGTKGKTASVGQTVGKRFHARGLVTRHQQWDDKVSVRYHTWRATRLLDALQRGGVLESAGREKSTTA